MISKLSHLTILVKNQEEALQFYTKKLGFKLHTDASFENMRWLTITPPEQPDVEIALMLVTNPADVARVGNQTGPYGIGAFFTDDCHKAFKELQSKGVEFISQPVTEPWGTGAEFKDLYGNRWYLCDNRK